MTTPPFPSPPRNTHHAPPAGHHPPAVPLAAADQPGGQRGPLPPRAGGQIAGQPYAAQPNPGQPYAAGPRQPGHGYPPPPPSPPRPPRTPWWQRDGVISKLLAGLGVLITLIGVVMMLVLVAQAGYFGPAARVGAGSALSVVLIGAGVWLFGRTGGRTGAVALATTGFAGLFMVVVAMTTHYHWLPSSAGLALAGTVATAAVALSTYWRSQPMTVLAFLAIAGLAPFITGNVDLQLVGFLVLLQAAGIVPEKLRGWATVAPVRTVPVVLALLADEFFSIGGHFTLQIAAAVTCAALGLVAVLLPRGQGAESVGAVVYAVASLPLLVAIPTIERPWSILAAAVLATVTVATLVIARPVRRVHRVGRRSGHEYRDAGSVRRDDPAGTCSRRSSPSWRSDCSPPLTSNGRCRSGRQVPSSRSSRSDCRSTACTPPSPTTRRTQPARPASPTRSRAWSFWQPSSLRCGPAGAW